MRISANKKVWKTLLCLAAGLLCCCCMLCLAACDEDSGGKPAEHTHDWGEWTVVQEPTCTREGQRQRVCKSDSSHVETEAIAALGHDLVGVPEQPATCTEEGHTAYKQCSRCWYTEGYNILRPAGHSASENDWCRDDYFHWQICSVCGEQFNKDEHEYSHLCVCGLESDYTLGLHFKLLYDGTYEVSKGQATDTVLKIPAIYHGRDVSSVATAAFRMYDCTEVILPDTITTIGINAFQYCSLSKITLSNNLTEMGDYAFADCKNLVSVDIPASLKEIPFFAFTDCSALSSVTLHEGHRCKSLWGLSLAFLRFHSHDSHGDRRRRLRQQRVDKRSHPRQRRHARSRRVLLLRKPDLCQNSARSEIPRRGCIWWLQTSYGNAADRTARRHFGDRIEPFERDTGLYQCCRSRGKNQDAFHIFGERLFV